MLKSIDKFQYKFAALLILVTIIFAITCFYYYNRSVQEDGSISWVDFRVYYYAGLNLQDGADIYHRSDGFFIYKYSPVFALSMSVLKSLNKSTTSFALVIWYIVLFVCTLVSLYYIKETVFGNGAKKERLGPLDLMPMFFIIRYMVVPSLVKAYVPSEWPPALNVLDWMLVFLVPLYVIGLSFHNSSSVKKRECLVLLIAFSLCARFLVHNIDRGQVNLLIMALLCLFIYYFLHRRDALAGVYLGTAVAIKLTPVLFILYMLARKRFRACISALLTFTALLLIPSLKWGVEKNINMLSRWVMSLRATIPTERLIYKNQSLMSMLSRFFYSESDIAITGLSAHQLSILVSAVYVLFLAGLLYFVFRKKLSRDNENTVYDLAIFLTAMIIISPVGTRTTFIHALLPCALLVKEVFSRKFKDKVLNTALASYAVLIYINTSDVLGHISVKLHEYSLMTWCIILLVGLLLYVKNTRAEEAAGV